MSGEVSEAVLRVVRAWGSEGGRKGWRVRLERQGRKRAVEQMRRAAVKRWAVPRPLKVP